MSFGGAKYVACIQTTRAVVLDCPRFAAAVLNVCQNNSEHQNLKNAPL